MMIVQEVKTDFFHIVDGTRTWMWVGQVGFLWVCEAPLRLLWWGLPGTLAPLV